MHDTAAADANANRAPRVTWPTAPAKTVRSKDGTVIAFDRIGHGAPVILVDAALCYRGMGQSRQLAALLAPHFTVITYDRRGRGESGDTAPYAVEREVEDIAALLREAGGSAYLWGMSSGAVLALEAASRLKGIEKLALYEAPFIVDDSRSTTEDDWVRIREAVAAQRRGAAVKFFLQAVGVPGVRHRADAIVACVAETEGHGAHASLRRRTRPGQPTRPAASAESVGISDRTDAGDGRRQESAVDAARESGARARIAERSVPHARWPDAHAEAESARSHIGGVLQALDLQRCRHLDRSES